MADQDFEEYMERATAAQEAAERSAKLLRDHEVRLKCSHFIPSPAKLEQSLIFVFGCRYGEQLLGEDG